jgi:hypothetical protein
MNSSFISKALRHGLCTGAVLGIALSAYAQIDVTFQVDMSAQIYLGKFVNGTDTVEARGGFQGWTGGFGLTNSPGNPNVYTGTYSVTDAPGTLEEYKFVVNGGNPPLGWESPSSTGGYNRQFTLTTTGSSQTLPVVLFNDQPIPSTTNNVTFQVDMTLQVIRSNFVNGVDSVEVRGSFQGWTGGYALTNNPTGANSNLYSGTFSITDAAGTAEQYKFIVDGGNGPLGWESPASTSGGNRTFTLDSGTSQTLPAVYFNDLGVSDILPVDTVVTFSVNMTNAVATDGHPFDPNADSVYLNGVYDGIPGSFWTWGLFTPVPAMTNNPPSLVYSIEVLIPAGNSISVVYKYGINGADNEAGFALNHLRYIRSSGSYTMPVDTFGNQLAEPSFGNLKVGAVSGGHVPVTWLGRRGVRLQTSSNLTSGSWVTHAETDGLNATNWPANGGTLFFRLVKP